MFVKNNKLDKKNKNANRTKNIYRLIQNHDRNMQNEKICDDYDENSTYFAFIFHDQIKSKIKN